jgi:hypothetical protein
VPGTKRTNSFVRRLGPLVPKQGFGLENAQPLIRAESAICSGPRGSEVQILLSPTNSACPSSHQFDIRN